MKSFCDYLKNIFSPPDHKDLIRLRELTPKRKPINCSDDIELLAYCLMPNHFHLFVKQKTKEGLKPFMKALATNYSMYFNQKYNRVGPLFQGTYKAVLITTEPYYLHITRCIHRNPIKLISKDKLLKSYPYSSYPYYLKSTSPDWLNTNEILKMFNLSKDLFANDLLSYKCFVESKAFDDNKSLSLVKLD